MKGSRVTLLANHHHPRILGGWMHVDFDENHHDSIMHSITGNVSAIKAIFVEETAPSGYIDDKDNKYHSVAIDVLGRYGIKGFNQSWQCGYDTFPLGSLLNILGAKSEFDPKLDAFKSDFNKELSLLGSILSQSKDS